MCSRAEDAHRGRPNVFVLTCLVLFGQNVGFLAIFGDYVFQKRKVLGLFRGLRFRASMRVGRR